MTRQRGDSGALGLTLSSAATHVLSNFWRRCIQVQCCATAVTSAATDQRGSEQRVLSLSLSISLFLSLSPSLSISLTPFRTLSLSLSLFCPFLSPPPVSLSLARVDSAEPASDSGSSGSFPPS